MSDPLTYGWVWSPLNRQTASNVAAFLGLFLADIVAKVENRMTPKIPRKPIFRDSCRGNALEANTKVGGRLGMKRCGAPQVAAREAHQRSLKLSCFTRKRLLQQSAPLRHADGRLECLLVGENRL
jgi:hypothetical protein